MKLVVLATVLVSALTAHAQSAGDIQKALTDEATRLQAWGRDPLIVAAVKVQNAKHVTPMHVKELDEQWSAGKAADLVKQITTGPCADHLRALLDKAHGEIFITDNQGALVCANAKTSDYWQGDEAKWQRAFLDGKGATFIDRPKFDDSSAQRLAQISVPVMDGGVAIGVITVGLSTEAVGRSQ